MRFRELRIAWSVGWGIACVLLIVLWVRSYWQVDQFMYNSSTASIVVGARQGYCGFVRTIITRTGENSWSMSSTRLPTGNPIIDEYRPKRRWQADSGLVLLPIWPFGLISLTLAAVPWIRWSKRFSLRTLLNCHDAGCRGAGAGGVAAVIWPNR
jgi:hypothetical protein